MKNIIILISILFMYVNLSAQDWTGRWEGALDAGGQKVRIVFNIKKNDGGLLQATMDSPDQMAYDIKMDEVVVLDSEITLTLSVAHAQFIGSLNDDKTVISGNWIQGVPMPLVLIKSIGEGIKRPQEPQGPFPYKIEEVSYVNKDAGDIKLAGTLTIPEGEGRFPVVVLISGSGPQDRDQSIMKHKPFWLLADFLSRNGIAVLRFDDRGFGESEGDFASATSADFATDVAAGITFLKKHPSIDAKKIGLMGHSEGGLIAPIVASKDKSVAFAVLLAGPGVPGKDLFIRQSYDINKLKGINEDLLIQLNKINAKLYQTLIDDKKDEKGTVDFMKAIENEYAVVSEENKKILGLDEASLKEGLNALQSKWLRYFIRANPSDFLRKVKCPVLALNGKKDLQVAAKMNLDAIESALNKAKNKNFKCISLPDLNHLFQTCETGAVEEYIQIEETFSPAAMKIILDWLLLINK